MASPANCLVDSGIGGLHSNPPERTARAAHLPGLDLFRSCSAMKLC